GKEKSETIAVSRGQFARQTRRLYLLSWGGTCSDKVVCGLAGRFVSRNPQPCCLPVEGISFGRALMACPKQSGMKMLGKNLVGTDLFSEVVLLSSTTSLKRSAP